MRIGFIGLGVMGQPMAANLLRRGYPMIVHTRRRERAASLEANGAVWAWTPGETADACDLIITMLPDSDDVVSVMHGDDGVFCKARAGLGWIDMSSISPVVARALAAEAAPLGIATLDAPVSGGEVGARDATLSIMVGGAAETLERFRPILECLGERIVHVGDSGAGQVAKVCNQMVIGGTIALVAEALVLGAKAGVSPSRIREALLGGFAQSRVLEVHGERMLSRNFAPGFRLALHQKDLAIALSTARAVGSTAAVTAVVSEMMNAASDKDLDHSALVRVFESMAGVSLGVSQRPNARPEEH